MRSHLEAFSGALPEGESITEGFYINAIASPMKCVLGNVVISKKIPTYTENIQEHHETLFSPPQPSVPVRSHLGAFSGDLPEGESIMEGFYINTIASPMSCEYFTTDLQVRSY